MSTSAPDDVVDAASYEFVVKGGDVDDVDEESDAGGVDVVEFGSAMRFLLTSLVKNVAAASISSRITF